MLQMAIVRGANKDRIDGRVVYEFADVGCDAEVRTAFFAKACQFLQMQCSRPDGAKPVLGSMKILHHTPSVMPENCEVDIGFVCHVDRCGIGNKQGILPLLAINCRAMSCIIFASKGTHDSTTHGCYY